MRPTFRQSLAHHLIVPIMTIVALLPNFHAHADDKARNSMSIVVVDNITHQGDDYEICEVSLSLINHTERSFFSISFELQSVDEDKTIDTPRFTFRDVQPLSTSTDVELFSDSCDIVPPLKFRRRSSDATHYVECKVSKDAEITYCDDLFPVSEPIVLRNREVSITPILYGDVGITPISRYVSSGEVCTIHSNVLNNTPVAFRYIGLFSYIRPYDAFYRPITVTNRLNGQAVSVESLEPGNSRTADIMFYGVNCSDVVFLRIEPLFNSSESHIECVDSSGLSIPHCERFFDSRKYIWIMP